MNAEPVLDYIRANWQRSIYRDADGSGFQGDDLPYPYSSPCIRGEGHFAFFFYWDTCFTNLGLLRHGHIETARDNIRNMLWLVRRQGYVPNHVALFNRSQPPYLCRMVTDYFQATGGPAKDPTFFAECAEGLRQEYHFWTTARHSPTGLQRHGHHGTGAEASAFYDDQLVKRLGLAKNASLADKVRIGGHHLGEAETGWDFNPRFDGRCLDHNAADLNGLLYGYETTLAAYSRELGWRDEALWETRAEHRRQRVNELLWSEERGLFLDCDFANKRHSPVASLATMLPLITGLATEEQAARIVANLPLFEHAHGLAVTEKPGAAPGYQWAYPNAWPPLTYVTIEALRRYGYESEARRLAKTFVATTVRLFERTGQLWEKTDAVTGEIAGGEYAAAPMMGWTAGIFVACQEFITTG